MSRWRAGRVLEITRITQTRRESRPVPLPIFPSLRSEIAKTHSPIQPRTYQGPPTRRHDIKPVKLKDLNKDHSLHLFYNFTLFYRAFDEKKFISTKHDARDSRGHGTDSVTNSAIRQRGGHNDRRTAPCVFPAHERIPW